MVFQSVGSVSSGLGLDFLILRRSSHPLAFSVDDTYALLGSWSLVYAPRIRLWTRRAEIRVWRKKHINRMTEINNHDWSRDVHWLLKWSKSGWPWADDIHHQAISWWQCTLPRRSRLCEDPRLTTSCTSWQWPPRTRSMSTGCRRSRLCPRYGSLMTWENVKYGPIHYWSMLQLR